MSDLLTIPPEELRAWWAGLNADQREAVAYYADPDIWARIERVCSAKKGGG